MEVRELRYFLAVAREENITRAAESLHIAQPSLSKQLMELEKKLGKKLLIRGKRKITLTEEGVLLRKRAEEILELVEKTQQEISSDTEDVIGDIYMGGGTPPSVLGAAAKLRERYPDVKFHFYSGDATDVSERLNHGTLDAAAHCQYEIRFFFPDRDFTMRNPCKERRSIFQRKSDNKRRYQDNASHHASENWSSE